MRKRGLGKWGTAGCGDRGRGRGRGQGQGQGRGQGRGRDRGRGGGRDRTEQDQGDDRADLQDLELKGGQRHLQHGPGQSWRALSGVAGTRRLLADMKDAQRPVPQRMNVHVSNRISPGRCHQTVGVATEILGRKDAPDMFKTVTKR